MFKKIKGIKTTIGMVLFFYIIYLSVSGWNGSLWSTFTVQVLPNASMYVMGFTVIFMQAAQGIRKENSELLLCVTILMGEITLLISNRFRNNRYFPKENFPTSEFDRSWMNSCGSDYAEVARDTLHFGLALNADSLFHIFSRVRTELSWVLPTCASMFAVLIIYDHVTKLEEYHHAGRNFFLLVGGVWGHSYGTSWVRRVKKGYAYER